jgi:hypothetical protein
MKGVRSAGGLWSIESVRLYTVGFLAWGGTITNGNMLGVKIIFPRSVESIDTCISRDYISLRLFKNAVFQFIGRGQAAERIDSYRQR